MAARGFLLMVLHAHLPFVRHPDHDRWLEEDWLYEAIIETYLPLLRTFDSLLQSGVRFRLTLTMSPTLTAIDAETLWGTPGKGPKPVIRIVRLGIGMNGGVCL